VRNEETLRTVKEERIVLHTLKRRANWIGHTLRRSCLLKHIIEGKIEGEKDATRRKERRRKHLVDDLKEKRGYLS
jgi:hypothetical protein